MTWTGSPVCWPTTSSTVRRAASAARGRRPAPGSSPAGSAPSPHVEVHAIHITGDVAVEEGMFTGTHNGVLRSPAGDIPATGRPVTVDYIQVLRFRDGKHASFSLMYDRLLMLEQLGLTPAPAG